jgi:hypothetical protein
MLFVKGIERTIKRIQIDGYTEMVQNQDVDCVPITDNVTLPVGRQGSVSEITIKFEDYTAPSPRF